MAIRCIDHKQVPANKTQSLPGDMQYYSSVHVLSAISCSLEYVKVPIFCSRTAYPIVATVEIVGALRVDKLATAP